MSIRIPTSGILWGVIAAMVLFVGAMAVGASITRGRASTALVLAEDSIAALVPALAASEQRAAVLGAELVARDTALLADTIGHGRAMLEAGAAASAARDAARSISDELAARIAADTVASRLSDEREAEHIVEVVAIGRRLDVALDQNRQLWLWRDAAVLSMAAKDSVVVDYAALIEQLEVRGDLALALANPPWSLRLWNAREETAVGVVIGIALYKFVLGGGS